MYPEDEAVSYEPADSATAPDPSPSSPAPPPMLTVAPPLDPPDDPAARCMAYIQDIAARAGQVAGVSVTLDTDGQGARVILTGHTAPVVRHVASALRRQDDGREWRYLGDGPDPESGAYTATLHVSPL